MIQTVDFFPPIVDDPFLFGQIAATNALSDVYAMGGVPSIAMNLICFPSCLDLSVVQAILEGGYSKVLEAKAVLAGGHTIEDNEPKYGLCVTGFVHPDRVLTNSAAKTGDVLVITKPVGTGVLSTAAKVELLNDSQYAQMIQAMTTLNHAACLAMQPENPTACTDVTGFGLLGHAFEMADGSKKTIHIHANSVPLLSGAAEFAMQGIIPAGMYRNQAYLEQDVAVRPGVKQEVLDLLFDPQTSGGLLIALPECRAQSLLNRLHDAGVPGTIIGQVCDREETAIVVE